MGSRKRSAKAKQVAQFKDGLGDSLSGRFAAESTRRRTSDAKREELHRKKSCTSKNSYASRWEAEAAMEACAEHGATNLSCYRCEYCGGWHLTSHPWNG